VVASLTDPVALLGVQSSGGARATSIILTIQVIFLTVPTALHLRASWSCPDVLLRTRGLWAWPFLLVHILFRSTYLCVETDGAPEQRYLPAELEGVEFLAPKSSLGAPSSPEL
jgi:hypothetical protein